MPQDEEEEDVEDGDADYGQEEEEVDAISSEDIDDDDDYGFEDDHTYAGGLFAEERELDFGQHTPGMQSQPMY